MTEYDLALKRSSLGISANKYFIFEFKEKYLPNIFDATQEHLLKQYYAVTRSEHDWYTKEVHDFIMSYDLTRFNGVPCRDVIKYLDTLIMNNL